MKGTFCRGVVDVLGNDMAILPGCDYCYLFSITNNSKNLGYAVNIDFTPLKMKTLHSPNSLNLLVAVQGFEPRTLRI